MELLHNYHIQISLLNLMLLMWQSLMISILLLTNDNKEYYCISMSPIYIYIFIKTWTTIWTYVSPIDFLVLTLSKVWIMYPSNQRGKNINTY